MALHILSLIHVDDDDNNKNAVPSSILRQVANTALFLIELSVCDYHFVPIRNSIVAIAAILNAIEMMELDPPRDDVSREASLSYGKDLRKQVMDVLSSIHYKFKAVKVSSARQRLWSLYKNSTEYCDSSTKLERSHDVLAVNDPPATPLPPKRVLVRQVSSPASCCNAKRIQMISDVPSLEFSFSSDSQDGCSDVSCVVARYSF